MNKHANDPLHGKTLQVVIEYLVETYGWGELGRKIRLKCFVYNPNILSSLAFLRKTPWARQKVEDLYLMTTATPASSNPESDPLNLEVK